MPGAILLYVLCGASAVSLERCWLIDNLLKRTFFVLAVGTAQLMLSVQLLSPGHWLTSRGLLLTSALLTVIIFFICSGRAQGQGRVTWGTLANKTLAEVAPSLKEPSVLALVVVSLAASLIVCIAGWLMIPYGDSYHVEMPLFWIQNRGLLPFPVANPRVVALSFESEALALPGFLYGHSPVMTVFVCGGSLLLSLWVIYSLARRTGAGVAASLCAGAIAMGYSEFAFESLHTGGEAILAGALFGGSLLFLMDSHGKHLPARSRIREMGLSVFLFLMSCGAKNSTLLLAPVYLVFLLMILRTWLHEAREARTSAQETQAPQPDPQIASRQIPGVLPSLTRPAILTVAVAGLAGLICSGVAWNYVANQLWFGNSRGPKTVSETVSTDFQPRSIWTRLCRGSVLTVYDTIWVPGSGKDKYASVVSQTVHLLGGLDRIADDDQTYYMFDRKSMTPRKGLGLLGIVFFLPGVAVAVARCLSRNSFSGSWGGSERFNTALLAAMTVGSFVLCHLMLRWQSIGMLRIMFPFIVAGAPLTASLLESRWAKLIALALLAVSCAMFFTFWLGHVSRRHGWSERASLNWIARLQNEHSMLARYQWKDQAPGDLTIREDYSAREIYHVLLAGIRQPCTIGFVGHQDSDSTYLFGQRYQNRVVPLVDARNPAALIEPPPNLDYLVASDRFSTIRPWAAAHGFEEIFNATNAKGEMLVLLQKLPGR